MSSHSTRIAALAAATGLVGTAAFHLLLAVGVPWGRAAWGGGYDQLPTGLRMSSALSAGVLLFAAIAVLGRAEYWRGPPALLRWTSWALVGLLALSALGNFGSRSRWENLFLGPIALTLSLLCLIVARGPVQLRTADDKLA
jgi:hypothetical protein